MYPNPLISESLISRLTLAPRLLKRLELSGFKASSAYRANLVSECTHSCGGASVELYWDEVAKELLSSGNLDIDRGRYIRGRGFYSSSYLNGLANTLDETAMPLHPCMRYVQNKNKTTEGRRDTQLNMNNLQLIKRGEYSLTGLSIDRWTGKSDFLKKALGEVADRNGYIKSKTSKNGNAISGYSKLSNSGLQFFAFYDAPNSQLIDGHLRLQFLIESHDGKGCPIYLGNLWNLLFGANVYTSYMIFEGMGTQDHPYTFEIIPENALVGIVALFLIFDELYYILCDAGL